MCPYTAFLCVIKDARESGPNFATEKVIVPQIQSVDYNGGNTQPVYASMASSKQTNNLFSMAPPPSVAYRTAAPLSFGGAEKKKSSSGLFGAVTSMVAGAFSGNASARPSPSMMAQHSIPQAMNAPQMNSFAMAAPSQDMYAPQSMKRKRVSKESERISESADFDFLQLETLMKTKEMFKENHQMLCDNEDDNGMNLEAFDDSIQP